MDSQRDIRVRGAQPPRLPAQRRESLAPRKLTEGPAEQQELPGEERLLIRGDIPVKQPECARVLKVRVEPVLSEHRPTERRQLEGPASPSAPQRP